MSRLDDPKTRIRALGAVLHAAGAAVLLLMAGLTYAFAVRPLDGEVADRRERAEELAAQFEKGPDVRRDHAHLLAALAGVKDKARQLEQRVPTEPLEAEFLSQIGGAAGGAGLQLRDYKPGMVRIDENHSRLEIELAGVGSYCTLCAFLDRLAALPRLSRVTRLDVASDAAGAYPITLSLIVYFNLQDKPEAKKAPGKRT